MNHDYLKLCLVTQHSHFSRAQYKKFILAAVRGGITAVQLREKSFSFNELKYFANELKTLLTPYRIPLIINDHIELAKAVDADGVHLGMNDGCPMQARRILGEHKIIGLTIDSLAALATANTLCHINYVAASAVFFSKAKPDCKMIWGIEGLKKIVTLSHHPVMAIGGIHLDNVEEIIRCGVHGIATVSAIHESKQPARMARHFIAKINAIR